jgi:hypothetical protein
MSGWRKRQVVELAQEAGVISGFDSVHPSIERFAALVREEATAEANAKSNASWAMMCEKMVVIEREACAKVCEHFADVDSGPDGIMQDYHAHLIRARGQA